MIDKPWPKGIQAITLFVEDLAAAKKFYAETFGLPRTPASASSSRSRSRAWI